MLEWSSAQLLRSNFIAGQLGWAGRARESGSVARAVREGERAGRYRAGQASAENKVIVP